VRVVKEEVAKNRKKMLSAAARLFRERGIGASGVDAITGKAGLTHGAVYSQFGSKEAVAAEAIREALIEGKSRWRRVAERKGRKAFPTIVNDYLSREHCDAAGGGCVVAALAGEIARQPDKVRDAFTEELRSVLDVLATTMPRSGRARSFDDAIMAFASMAGALILARTVRDRNLSNRILKATAKRIVRIPESRRI
jgi:TetR/AcrR family transcriptional repressor of nem operon